MKPQSTARVLFVCLLLALSTVARSQTALDADDADVAALQQRVDIAHKEKIPELEHGPYLLNNPGFSKSCRTGHPFSSQYMGDMDAAAACAKIGTEWENTVGEQVLLKGCSYAHEGSDPYNPHQSTNPCVVLALNYISAGRFIEALAALKLPNAKSGGDRQLAYIRWTAYKALGNKSLLKSELHAMCYDLDEAARCTDLKSLGEDVDVSDAYQRQHEAAVQRNAEDAQKQADAEQESRDRAAGRTATVTALSNIGATQQPPPGYSSPPVATRSAPSQTASSSSSPTCRDMTYCVKVVSSNYDANHFLHVVVRNDCNSAVRITTSTYAQNRNCTVGQTANFSPGSSQDLGASTGRNWYQVQADDSVRSSVDGSGCRLVVPNSCY